MPLRRLRPLFRALPVLAALFGHAAPAAAQVPNVGFTFPPGVKTGTKATVNLNGGNLKGATTVLISGEGVTAQIVKNTEAGALPIELTVAPDAPQGLRELRVVTPGGTSNAARVWVGAYDGLAETEPNNALSAAQKLAKLPVTVDGQVNGAEDVDHFTFEAAAGDTYVFDLVANRMASPLDGFLTLFDARGKTLAYDQEPFERDPRLVYTFKTAGTYTIQVRDTLYRNGAPYTYRLTLGKVPVITGYLPLGGRPGQTVNMVVDGYNLGDTRYVTVKIPESGSRELASPAVAAGPLASPIEVMPSDLDDTVEPEPDDTASQAFPLETLPIAVSGRIDKRGDKDYFKIKPAVAGTLVIAVQARTLESRIDSMLRVFDTAGKELASNDDADGKDSRVSISAAANTEYVIEVSSVDQNSGPEAYYRLRIAPPGTPDFRLTVTPDEINLAQGGSTAVTVSAARVNGYAGPIELRVEGLPGGMTTSPMTIQPGQNAITFTITAPASMAAGTMAPIRVVGTATINNAAVEHAARPIETYQPPLAQQNQVGQRETLIFTTAVGPAAPYALDVEPRQITVKKGTNNVEIKVKATRQMGQTAAITVAVAGQPANVTPTPAPVPANGNEVVLKLNVAANAPVGTFPLIVTGNLNNNVQTAPALTLVITN